MIFHFSSYQLFSLLVIEFIIDSGMRQEKNAFARFKSKVRRLIRPAE